jgi:hypothetical protein
MFSSVAEFISLLVRHAMATETPAARAKREKMLANARWLVKSRHTWAHRANQIVHVMLRNVG